MTSAAVECSHVIIIRGQSWREWPGVLAPPPALAQEEPPNAAAAREQQPELPLPQLTARAWQGLAGDFTSSLGDLGSAVTPGQWQPPPG